MEKNTFEHTLQLFACLLIIIGLLCLIGICVAYSQQYNLTLFGQIDTEKTADFGTYVAGLVGPFWALSGVILFYLALSYQRQDLNLQREELQKTREEFELSRYTDITYKQITLIDTTLSRLSWNNSQGLDALVNIVKELLLIDDQVRAYINNECVFDENFKKKCQVNLGVINQIHFANLMVAIADHLTAFHNIIEKSQLKESQKREFINLLGLNVPGHLITLIQRSHLTVLLHNKLSEDKKLTDNSLDQKTKANIESIFKIFMSYKKAS